MVYLLDNDPDELAVGLWVDFMAQHQTGWDDLFYSSKTLVAINLPAVCAKIPKDID